MSAPDAFRPVTRTEPCVICGKRDLRRRPSTFAPTTGVSTTTLPERVKKLEARVAELTRIVESLQKRSA
jgi:hypothetical protein